jgi:hypothetical protein
MSKQIQTKSRETKASTSKNGAYKAFLASIAIIIILAMVLSMIRF